MIIPDAPPVEVTIDGTTHVFDLDEPQLPDWIKKKSLKSGGYPYDKKMDEDAYAKELEALQEELVKVLYWLQEAGQRVLAIFEGRDAAGKGGSIGAIRENLNPRYVRTVALSKPSDVQMGQWYYQRYIEHFPTKGEMVLFDRSWYNRAGVEPVMGFCTPEQHKSFLEETPHFEKIVVNDGIHLFKFWIDIGREMQLRRFHDRRHSKLKVWKLSPVDIKALTMWDDYTKARDSMLEATDSKYAPWTLILGNDKRRARLNVIRSILHRLDYTGKDKERIGAIDPKIIADRKDLAR
ncbi:MAG: polyphosphate kinase 2 [Nitratireductor sp.]|jgi:polyphosphate kinase 2|nr:polyphosphate kinase 2 [Nitratireductor sp.]